MHLGLVLHHHQSHDVAVPAEIIVGREEIIERSKIGTRFAIKLGIAVRSLADLIAHVAHLAMSARDIPSAPPLLEIAGVIREKGAAAKLWISGLVGENTSHQVAGNTLGPT